MRLVPNDIKQLTNQIVDQAVDVILFVEAQYVLLRHEHFALTVEGVRGMLALLQHYFDGTLDADDSNINISDLCNDNMSDLERHS